MGRAHAKVHAVATLFSATRSDHDVQRFGGSRRQQALPKSESAGREREKPTSKGPIFLAGADRPAAEMARLTLKTSCGTIELEQGG
jgi:hypothetical protein